MAIYVTFDENDHVMDVINSAVPPVLAGAVYEVVVLPTGDLTGDQVAVSSPVESLRHLENHMLGVDGFLIPRPSSPTPIWNATTKTLSIPASPIGTIVSVTDVTGDEIMGEVVADTPAWSSDIQFPDSGRYEVEITAPLPHFPVIIELEI